MTVPAQPNEQASGNRPRLRKARTKNRGRRPLPHRPDVLVEPEDVGWIVGVLQRHEALVFLRPVGRQDPVYAFLRLLTQVVDVDAARREGLHRGPEFPCPPPAGLDLGRDGTNAEYEKTVARVAVAERGLVKASTADGASQFFDRHVA